MKKERTVEELYAQDPERADSEVFGRNTGLDRRGFLGGAGLAAMGAAVGGAIPFAANMPGGMILPRRWRRAPRHLPPRRRDRNISNIPGKSDKLVVLGDRPLVAETPETCSTMTPRGWKNFLSGTMADPR